MKEKLQAYIREQYPDAIMDDYICSKWGTEQHFYPSQSYKERNFGDPYTCVIENGKYRIYTEF